MSFIVLIICFSMLHSGYKSLETPSSGNNMMKSQIKKFNSWKKYSNCSDMPDWLLVSFGAPSFLATCFLSYSLYQILPEYFAILIKTNIYEWGWQGWFVTFIFAVVGVFIWHFGSIASQCNRVLQDRWYK
jgi:hypothetical protein